MPTELLLGPPGSGKTWACIKRIQETQTRQPMAKIWVLLPEGQNIAYFRKRFAEAGGGVGVNTGSFSAFYQNILRNNGIFTPVISPSLEHRLVKETIDSAYAGGILSYYAAIRDKPGFNLALQDIFSELGSAYISPERFSEYTQKGTPAKCKLTLLYEKFVTRPHKLNWIDRIGQIW